MLMREIKEPLKLIDAICSVELIKLNLGAHSNESDQHCC